MQDGNEPCEPRYLEQLLPERSNSTAAPLTRALWSSPTAAYWRVWAVQGRSHLSVPLPLNTTHSTGRATLG